MDEGNPADEMDIAHIDHVAKWLLEPLPLNTESYQRARQKTLASKLQAMVFRWRSDDSRSATNNTVMSVVRKYQPCAEACPAG